MVPDALVTPFFVLIMALGFGGLVFIHEMGHFLAAKWAKVRVYAFAIGFGRPIASYRHGLGFRTGSSEQEYLRLRGGEDEARTSEGVLVSHTEYRLNMLPFGGYVKMMGQDDVDPSQRPDHPASFMNAKKWKRVVILLGGVVANVVLAMLMFVVVYGVGIKEVAPVVGGVVDGSPADVAGIEDGSRILSVDGVEATSFTDVIIGPALHTPGKAIEISYESPGGEVRTVSLVPEELGAGLPYREVGLRAATSASLPAMPIRQSDRALRVGVLAAAGLDGVSPGAQAVALNGEAIESVALQDGSRGVRFRSVQDAISKAYDAGGRVGSLSLTFELPDGTMVEREAPRPAAELRFGLVEVPGGLGSSEAAYWPVEHLLGMTPLMGVGGSSQPQQGLEVGDTILSVGTSFFPDPAGVIRMLRENAGRAMTMTVLRGEGDAAQVIELSVRIDSFGRIGFNPVTSRRTILAATPAFMEQSEDGSGYERSGLTALERVGVSPPLPGGVRVELIDGVAVETIDDAFGVLRDVTREALEAGEGARVDVGFVVLEPDAVTAGMPVELLLELSAAEVEELHDAVWRSPKLLAAFGPLEGTVQADGPVDAVIVGGRRTLRALQQTYLTLQRILQNTVPANQIQGPVGITHTGSVIAEQGLIYLLLILALISANLAVVNLIPIPITDGGQLLMLVYEAVRGKPLPVVVQSLITFAGLLIVIAIFLFVTFNDISRILGGP